MPSPLPDHDADCYIPLLLFGSVPVLIPARFIRQAAVPNNPFCPASYGAPNTAAFMPGGGAFAFPESVGDRS